MTHAQKLVYQILSLSSSRFSSNSKRHSSIRHKFYNIKVKNNKRPSFVEFCITSIHFWNRWIENYEQLTGCETQLAWKCLFTPLLRGGGFWPVKEIRLIWFMVWFVSSVVGLCMQDHKSLCPAVTICATLVNVQTHIHNTQTDNILTSLYE